MQRKEIREYYQQPYVNTYKVLDEMNPETYNLLKVTQEAEQGPIFNIL